MDRLAALIESKRVFMLVVGLLMLLFSQFGLDQETATWFVTMIAAYIAGESYRASDHGIYSRRFIAVLVTAATWFIVDVAADMYQLSDETIAWLIEAIQTLASGVTIYVAGDSIRAVERKTEPKA